MQTRLLIYSKLQSLQEHIECYNFISRNTTETLSVAYYIYRPGGEGGEGHPEGKFVRPTFLVNSGALILKMHVIRASRGAFACNLGLKPRFPKI